MRSSLTIAAKNRMNMRLSAALLVLCAALLACTPASATWIGSAPAYMSNEVTAGSCTYDANAASYDPNYKCSSSGTCIVQAASCAAAKAATAVGPYTTTRLEATSATTFCQHLDVGGGYKFSFFNKMDCSTRVQSQWMLTADQNCTTTPPPGSPMGNGTFLTGKTMIEGVAGGCMHMITSSSEGEDCEGNGRIVISHYRHGINTTSGDLVAEYKKICPSWYTNQVAPPTTTPTATPAPAAAAIHFVTMTVTMPYSKV